MTQPCSKSGGLLQEITRHASENPFAESSMTIRSGDNEVQGFRDRERVELGRCVPEQGLAPSNGVYPVACKPSDNIFDTAIGRRRITILTRDGRRVYVANYSSNTVSVIDTAEPVEVGVHPEGVAVGIIP